jgi:ribosomal protein S18 acetylase RimI-like enzyme
VTEGARQAAARVTAATLTLLSREMERQPPPFKLWSEPLSGPEIRDVALAVAAGEAAALWVEEHHPARGLSIVRPMGLESALLGFGSLRLTGPWMVESDPAERRLGARAIAAKAKAMPANGPKKFLSVKTWEDPAAIGGFLDEGFQVAQFSSRFFGELDPSKVPEFPFLYHSGLSLRSPPPRERAGWLDSLGDLFYDGHHMHGPFLPSDFSGRLWREVALRDLGRGDPSVFLWDERQDRPVGLALAAREGPQGSLTILHVAEERRGQGLGRLLICEMIRSLIKIGVSTLSIETASWNLPALQLYQSLGLRLKPPLAVLHLEA